VCGRSEIFNHRKLHGEMNANFVAGATYLPVIAIGAIATFQRHRYEMRFTTVTQPARVSRPWLRALQLLIVAWLLRVAWFWISAAFPNPCPGSDHIKCPWSIVITLINRLGQLAQTCAFAIAISCWSSVGDDETGRGRATSKVLPILMLVICTWLVFCTLALLGVELVFSVLIPLQKLEELNWLVVSDNLYQGYILMVALFNGFLAMCCWLLLPCVTSRLRWQVSNAERFLETVASGSVNDDEQHEDDGIRSVAMHAVKGARSVLRTRLRGLRRHKQQNQWQGTGSDQWFSIAASGALVEGAVSSDDLRTPLLQSESPSPETGAAEALGLLPAPHEAPSISALQRGKTLSAKQEKQVASLRALLATLRNASITVPLTMIWAGVFIMLRGVMFAWRPFGSLVLCGGVAVPCPSAYFTGVLGKVLYPWAFYPIPDIASGLVMVVMAVPWRDVFLGCSCRCFQSTTASRPMNCGAPAEQRMMAAATVAALDVTAMARPARAPVYDTAITAAQRFSAVLRWVGLPAMQDVIVMAQVQSYSDAGDAVSSGAWDKSAGVTT
jgi:hypothetical protein